MIRVIILVVVFSLHLNLLNAQETNATSLFVSVLDKNPVIESRQGIDDLIEFSKKAHVKTLFVQVYRANKAWFKTKAAADSSPYTKAQQSLKQDPLQYLINQAHANGIEVHAWLNLLSLSKNIEAPILKKYGTKILTTNKEPKQQLGDYLIDNQYFLEPTDPHVRQELLTIVADLIKGYPKLDGVQFDYIRYPDVHPYYGHSPFNRAKFKRAMHVKEIDDKDPRWHQWKRDRVTDLVKTLAEHSRATRPHIQVSTTGCVSYMRAMEEAFQDWPRWVNSGVIDFVTVMSYPPDLPAFEKNITEVKAHVKDLSKANIAVGAYKFLDKPASFKEQYDVCKALSLRGCSIFHYSNFIDHQELKDIVFK